MLNRPAIDSLLRGVWLVVGVCATATAASANPDPASSLEYVRDAQTRRVAMIERAASSVVCIYDDTHVGRGSGVLIDAGGYGLTNFHVIDGLLESRHGWGGLSDGNLYELLVLGIDPTGDVAMFRLIGRDQFPCARLADSDAVCVGEPVVAMGNPFQLSEDQRPTVTIGCITGVHRFQEGIGRNLIYTDCIQTDAPVNPGNSGGPLFNDAGEIIGINGRISINTRGRFNVGFAYAISSNQIKRFLPRLYHGELAMHGTLGAVVDDADGVRITRLVPRGAGARAGLLEGDRIVSLDGVPVDSANRLNGLLGTLPADWSAPIEVDRAGRRVHLVAQLDPIEPDLAEPFTVVHRGEPDAVRWAKLCMDAVHPRRTTPVRRALSATSVLADRSPTPGHRAITSNRYDSAVSSASRRVVKLYGLSVGTQVGYGSGVIVSPDGDVVTVSSLLIDARALRAVDWLGRNYAAEVVHRDDARQLALLRLHAQSEAAADDTGRAPNTTLDLPYFDLSKSVDPSPGDWVIAAGNAFKVATGSEAVSIARGVLSTRTRLDARRRAKDFPYRGDVWVIDAITSNPGAPGGALVNVECELVGMIGRLVVSNRTHTHLNHAIPRDVLLEFMGDTHDGRLPELAGGALTVSTPDADAQDAGYRIARVGYRKVLPFVDRVVPNSPAASAGLRKDDLILSVDGHAVGDADEHNRRIGLVDPEEPIELIVRRGRRIVTIRIERGTP